MQEDLEKLRLIREKEDQSNQEFEKLKKELEESYQNFLLNSRNEIETEKKRLESDRLNRIESEKMKLQDLGEARMADARKKAASMDLSITESAAVKIFADAVKKYLEK